MPITVETIDPLVYTTAEHMNNVWVDEPSSEAYFGGTFVYERPVDPTVHPTIVHSTIHQEAQMRKKPMNYGKEDDA